jgi:hypothetical protein
MEITITKILKVEVFFEMKNGNWTVALVQTEKDEKPLSFRMTRSFGTEEWQFMQIMQFANVEQSTQLIGKEIKVVLDTNSKVVGYGSMTRNSFFLWQNIEIKEYEKNDLLKMDLDHDSLLFRDHIKLLPYNKKRNL